VWGFDVASMSMGYSAPNLDAISLKCLQGLPLGSFRKKRTFNMILSSLHYGVFMNLSSMIGWLESFCSGIDPRG
jgi:hypothetical protein